MTQPGTEAQPLRVAIIGAGPSGFYAAEHLLSHPEIVVEVDLIDRLPTPYGLVRYGVAPDHQKIKSVTAAYDKTAANPRFRFFGNVEFGKHLTREDLAAHYHQMLFTTGAQTDRRIGIPGEDLAGSYPATEFVAWYNGHPDYVNYEFDLQQEAAAVVGVGDVPAADATALAEEVELDEASKAALDRTQDRTTMRKVETIQGFAARPPGGKPRKLVMRFLVSPVELSAADGHVAGMRLVHNILQATSAGTLVAKPTDRLEDLSVGLIFRAVGYRGVP